MKVYELLNNIKNNEYYVNGSLYLKSYDETGAVYKYLIKKSFDIAERKEIFIELNPNDAVLDLLDREVLSYIEIYPPK